MVDNIHGITIGTDPEFFVKENGKFISAHGLVQGTKENPLKLNGGAVQVDGMALEINTDPADNFKDFNDNINKVLGQVQQMLPGKEFVFEPVAHFSQEIMDAQPDEATELGCDPDFNAWEGGKENKAPDGSAVNFRTAAGHIHVGWTKDMDVNDPEHIEACIMLTVALDKVLGFTSLCWDQDRTRQQLYGKYGSFRPKPYGMEYRVLSNVWLKNIDLRKVVFETTILLFNELVSKKARGGLTGTSKNHYQELIEYSSKSIESKAMYLSAYYPHYIKNSEELVTIIRNSYVKSKPVKKIRPIIASYEDKLNNMKNYRTIYDQMNEKYIRNPVLGVGRK